MTSWRSVWVAFLAAGLLATGLADGFRERALALYQAGKKAEAERVLREWEARQPRDPELYNTRFTLWINEADLDRQTVLGGMHFAVEKDAVVLGESGPYGPSREDRVTVRQADSLFHLATAKLRAGIALFPERLDMRFELVKAYQSWYAPSAQVRVLREALAWRQSVASQPWTWREGSVLPQPENQFLPRALEEYATFYLFDTVRSDGRRTLEHSRQLAGLLIAYYPASSRGPFSLGLYYMQAQQWPQALEQLKKADALQPAEDYLLRSLIETALKLKLKLETADYITHLRQLPGTEKQVAEYEKTLKKLR